MGSDVIFIHALMLLNSIEPFFALILGRHHDLCALAIGIRS